MTDALTMRSVEVRAASLAFIAPVRSDMMRSFRLIKLSPRADSIGVQSFLTPLTQHRARAGTRSSLSHTRPPSETARPPVKERQAVGLRVIHRHDRDVNDAS